jgi:hypothetical protein
MAESAFLLNISKMGCKFKQHKSKFCNGTIFIFMLLLLVGCFPLPRIVKKTVGGLGPEYPKELVAVIKGSRHPCFILLNIYMSSTAKIDRVDNQVFPYGADEVRIPSGPHKVVIIIEKRTWVLGSISHPEGVGGLRLLVFRFETEAGHTYKVDIPLYWRKNSTIKIINKATKEIVDSQVVE